jgi:hypothetical protein
MLHAHQHRPPAARRSMQERRSSYKTGSGSKFNPHPSDLDPLPQPSNDHGFCTQIAQSLVRHVLVQVKAQQQFEW